MTRVVVDANVYISALVFGGMPQTVFQLIEHREMQLYISKPIADEVSGVLAKKFRWTQQELDEFLPPLWGRCTRITPAVTVNCCADPDDNRVLACAQAAEADFLVTGDDDLLRLKRFGPTRILLPRAFVELHKR